MILFRKRKSCDKKCFNKNLQNTILFLFCFQILKVKLAKPYFYILFLTLPLLSLAEPSPSDSTPSKCRWNLINTIFETYSKTNPISYAKSPFNPDCKDVSYDEDETSGACNPTDDCVSGEVSLVYEVFYPPHDYAALKLPAVILFHPGGFMECPSYTMTLMQDLCSEFAKRGFVAFNVEYRRGRIKDGDNDYISAQQILATYRACQDARGAIRSIIKRQRNHGDFNDPYEIDTNRIFIGGASAGAVISLNAAWYTNTMVKAIFPTPPGEETIEDALGAIDADYYYGEPDIQYKSKILGNLFMWGGVGIPISYYSNQAQFFVDYNAKLKPLIAFQGARDVVFPFKMNSRQLEIFPPPVNPHFPYSRESRCLINSPFILNNDPNDTIPDMIRASSLNFYTAAKEIDPALPVELYVDCQMKHGLDKDGPNFQSEF